MSTYLPSYDQLAEQRGVRRCRGLADAQVCHFKHQKGEAEILVDLSIVIHWADRRASREGIKRFLFLIAYAETGIATFEGGPTERWRRQYRALRRVSKYLAEAKVRVPLGLWHRDKTLLKSALLNVSTLDEEREEAMEWARTDRG